MRIVILKDPEEVAEFAAEEFRRQIQGKPDSILGFATGSTPLILYRKLIDGYRKGEISFRRVRSFNLDEYLGLQPDHPKSYRSTMNRILFDHIDIDKTNTFVPDGAAGDPYEACAEYEEIIEKLGGIDLQLLGIGSNGHIGFNEPSSGLRSRTRIKTLSMETIRNNARFFDHDEFQPRLSITMGIGSILDTRKAILLATGKNKADAVRAAIEGPVTAACPASALQMHTDVAFVLDEAAAAQLKDKDYYRHVEQCRRALDARLARRSRPGGSSSPLDQ